MEEKVTLCGICPGACGVVVELEGGRLERIRPISKGHPVGTLCVRGAHAKEIVYSPDRLKHPLRRVGAKGEGRFERVSWDEAMDGIAQRMQQIKAESGPQALMMYGGRGAFEASLVDAFAPPGIHVPTINGVLFPFGSPNTAGVSSLCYVSYGILASVPTLGVDMRSTYGDYRNSKAIVCWGANPATDSPPIGMKRIMQAKAKGGAKIIVIDPLRSEIAQKADLYVPLRSGTDGALALSLAQVVIEEGLYDEDFVEHWTEGFPQFAQYVQNYRPEVAEGITGVPATTIRKLARILATQGPAALTMYTGLEYSNCGVQSIRAVLTLWAITGNLDVPGGLVIRAKTASPFQRIDMEPPAEPKPIGADRYPLFTDLLKAAHFMEAPRAILEGDPYPIRGMILVGGSILTAYPNPALWEKCLAKLDLLVVVDRFMTGDARYADYVLPATTMFEIESVQKYPSGYVQLRQRVVEPVGEARNDYLILADLARRLGYGHLYPQTEEELVNFILKGSPVTVEDLRKNPQGMVYERPPREFKKYEKGLLRSDGKPGFDTPSGKVEIASSILSRYGYDPLPVYTEPKEGPLANPELAQKYPLVLTTGARIQSTFRSQHLNIPGLLKMQPKPHCLIHPQDAAARGIADGDKVYVETPRGRVPYTAKVTDAVQPGSVEVNVGGGSPLHPLAWREANTNYLTDPDNRDPISGFPVLKALLCQVSRA
jgi:anaerobic selenocysteine-containing dehydrogenase